MNRHASSEQLTISPSTRAANDVVIAVRATGENANSYAAVACSR